jgi:trichohyalin
MKQIHDKENELNNLRHQLSQIRANEQSTRRELLRFKRLQEEEEVRERLFKRQEEERQREEQEKERIRRHQALERENRKRGQHGIVLFFFFSVPAESAFFSYPLLLSPGPVLDLVSALEIMKERQEQARLEKEMQKQAMIEERRQEELMMKERAAERARLKMEEERREHELMLARQKEEEEFRIKQEEIRIKQEEIRRVVSEVFLRPVSDRDGLTHFPSLPFFH